jgi:hypothetical protein
MTKSHNQLQHVVYAVILVSGHVALDARTAWNPTKIRENETPSFRPNPYSPTQSRLQKLSKAHLFLTLSIEEIWGLPILGSTTSSHSRIHASRKLSDCVVISSPHSAEHVPNWSTMIKEAGKSNGCVLSYGIFFTFQIVTTPHQRLYL